MNIIEYKGFSKKENRWIFGGLQCQSDSWRQIIVRNQETGNWDEYDVVRESICQRVGCNACDGSPMYTNDIVRLLLRKKWGVGAIQYDSYNRDGYKIFLKRKGRIDFNSPIELTAENSNKMEFTVVGNKFTGIDDSFKAEVKW